MNFTITKEQDLAVFHLDEPRMDSVLAHELKAELLIVTQEEIDVLIIDLSSVTFCDSSGLGALLLAERQMRERDGGVIVVDANGKVASLLDIAKLNGIIPVFATIGEARAALEND
jgi:anti-sigma B factor antagonist